MNKGELVNSKGSHAMLESFLWHQLLQEWLAKRLIKPTQVGPHLIIDVYAVIMAMDGMDCVAN